MCVCVRKRKTTRLAGCSLACRFHGNSHCKCRQCCTACARPTSLPDDVWRGDKSDVQRGVVVLGSPLARPSSRHGPRKGCAPSKSSSINCSSFPTCLLLHACSSCSLTTVVSRHASLVPHLALAMPFAPCRPRRLWHTPGDMTMPYGRRCRMHGGLLPCLGRWAASDCCPPRQQCLQPDALPAIAHA